MSVRDRAIRTGLAVRRRAVITLADHRWHAERAAIAHDKAHQRARFDALVVEAPRRFDAIRDAWSAEAAVTEWREHVATLEKRMLPAPSWRFLRDDLVLFTMFILAGRRVLTRELAFLRDHLTPTHLASVVEEDPVGDPVLGDGSLRTSLQAVHHLYHLLRFEAATGVNTSALTDPMVEWGAGYGSFARIYRRHHGGRPTQVLLDLPVFSLLQWLFLSTVFGSDEVVLADRRDHAIVEGLINIVPVAWSDAVPGDTGLFVSTWALSETPAVAQDVVLNRHWFGARHLLLAHQRASEQFPAAERIGHEAVAAGATSEPVDVLAGSAYVFR
jgi:hypothetical protein